MREVEIPANLRSIRVRVAADKYVNEVEFRSETETQIAQAHNGGEWREFRLERGEQVIGFYGDSFEDYYSYFKRLGFIIAK